MAYLNFIPPVIAHRGVSGLAPENTLAAFTKAIQLGIQWVEFDVMLSADNIPVIFHDETLNRTTNGAGYLHHYPYAYLQTLDAGSWFDPKFAGERIPSLQQTMEFLLQSPFCANVELKAVPGNEAALVNAVLKVITPYLALHPERILFSSFSIATLKLLRQHAPNSLMGVIIDEWQKDWLRICDELQCVSLHLNQEYVTQEIVQEIKMNDKLLLCYTVNDIHAMQRLFAFGVDAVFTDSILVIKEASRLVNPAL